MEVMETSLDKFYKKIYANGETIPEEVLAKIAYSVSVMCFNTLFPIKSIQNRIIDFKRNQRKTKITIDFLSLKIATYCMFGCYI